MDRRHTNRVIRFRFFLIGIYFLNVAHGESWSVGDALYEDVRIQETTPATVTIFHSRGITQLELKDLPANLQEQLGYDKEKALLWLDARAQRFQKEKSIQQAARKKRISERAVSISQSPSEPKVIPPNEVVFHTEVDLRPKYRELGLHTKNQGRRPSCSIFALVSALEYEHAQLTGKAERLSEDFLIWATLKLHPGIPLDNGFNFAEVFSALQTYGVPPFSVMPNRLTKRIEEIQPDEEVISMAKDLRTAIPVWFRRDDPYLVERLTSVLNQEKPIVIALRWPNWRVLERNFLLNKQTPMENAAHAVTLVGYRNQAGTPDGTTFIFRNSYGFRWGSAGCGFVTANYIKENLVGAFFMRLQ